MKESEKEAAPQDELERLEQLHQRMKEAQEAWRKLLKNMGKLDPEETDNNERSTPKT